MTTSTK